MSTTSIPVTENQWQQYLFYVSNLLKLGFDKEDILDVEYPGLGIFANKGKTIMEDQNSTDFQNKVMFADGSIYFALNASNLLWIKDTTRPGEEDMDTEGIAKKIIVATIFMGYTCLEARLTKQKILTTVDIKQRLKI